MLGLITEQVSRWWTLETVYFSVCSISDWCGLSVHVLLPLPGAPSIRIIFRSPSMLLKTWHCSSSIGDFLYNILSICPLMVLQTNSSSTLPHWILSFLMMAKLKVYCVGEGSHLLEATVMLSCKCHSFRYRCCTKIFTGVLSMCVWLRRWGGRYYAT